MIEPLQTREITSPADERIIDRLNEVIALLNQLNRLIGWCQHTGALPIPGPTSDA